MAETEKKNYLFFTKIINDASSFCQSDLSELCDGKLSTEDGYNFRIHKMALAERSPYFHRLFCGDMGRGRNDFLIPGIRGEILNNVLSYIYGGTVPITKENVRELLVAADYILIEDLVKYISKVYTREILSCKNCFPFYLVGLNVNCRDIVCESFRFVQVHFEATVSADAKGFAELPLETLKQLLGSKNLRVRDENVVFTAIAKWVEADLTHRQSFVPDLLMFIALSDVDENLAEKILTHDIVARNPHCAELNELKQSGLSLCDFLPHIFGYWNFHWQPLSSMFNSFSQILRYLNISALRKFFPNQSIPSQHFISQTLGYWNIIVLRKYFQNHPKPTLVSFNSRQSEYLWFIVQPRYQTPGNVHCVVYASYDEKLDLWRKIVEVDCCPEMIVCVEHYVYMFFDRLFKKIACFDLIAKKWNVLPDFRASSKSYHQLVRLKRLIYIFGYMGSTVHVFDPYEDYYYSISLTRSLWDIMAVKLGDRIYVVGRSSTDTMLAQTYDSESELWVILPPPSVFRYDFELVAYRGRLYVIGGHNDNDTFLNSVEVFDPEKGAWEKHLDLPHTFYSPKATVLNDELIVYDVHNRSFDSYPSELYCETNPTVLWNEELGLWKAVDKLSPKNILKNYEFFIQETEGCMHKILRDNKDPATTFIKSPFQ